MIKPRLRGPFPLSSVVHRHMYSFVVIRCVRISTPAYTLGQSDVRLKEIHWMIYFCYSGCSLKPYWWKVSHISFSLCPTSGNSINLSLFFKNIFRFFLIFRALYTAFLVFPSLSLSDCQNARRGLFAIFCNYWVFVFIWVWWRELVGSDNDGTFEKTWKSTYLFGCLFMVMLVYF